MRERERERERDHSIVPVYRWQCMRLGRAAIPVKRTGIKIMAGNGHGVGTPAPRHFFLLAETYKHPGLPAISADPTDRQTALLCRPCPCGRRNSKRRGLLLPPRLSALRPPSYPLFPPCWKRWPYFFSSNEKEPRHRSRPRLKCHPRSANDAFFRGAFGVPRARYGKGGWDGGKHGAEG